MDRGKPTAGPRRFRLLLAVPFAVAGIAVASALAAGGPSGPSEDTAAEAAAPSVDVAPGGATPAEDAAPAETMLPEGATTDGATPEGAAPAAPASGPADTTPAASSDSNPAVIPQADGHAAPPKPPPPGPDLTPLRRTVKADLPDETRFPALFVPDPLRPIPEHDLGILREEEAPSTEPPPDPEAKRQLVQFGKDLFFSTTAFDQKPSKGPLVFGERLSCATCHSGPGFTDGRTHMVGPTAERELAPRHTPHLFGLNGTEPFGWDARNPTLENQARGAITSDLEMNGREPTVREMAALAAFMDTLAPPPAVPGVDFDPELARIGEQLFKDPRGIDPAGEFSPNVKISCETCHVRPHFTDNKPHRLLIVDEAIDPGVVDEKNQIRGFDTPPLKGVRFTAPYFHQGAAGDPTAPANLIYGTDAARIALRNNVMNFYNIRFNMGFSDRQLDALTEFLMSL